MVFCWYVSFYAVFNLCFITPLMHILGLYFLKIDRIKVIRKILLIFGKYSMNIWYIQCIVFSSLTNEYIQPLVYFPRNIVLATIWMMILCTALAYILDKLQKVVYYHTFYKYYFYSTICKKENIVHESNRNC